jgi:hypothetical protein
MLLRVELFSVIPSYQTYDNHEESIANFNCGPIPNNSVDIKNMSKIYKTMPSGDFFNFRQDAPMAQDCFQRYTHGKKDTQIKLCRIGLDSSSSPSYLLLGDSIAMVYTNTFNQLQTPGMFAAFDGDHCSPTYSGQPIHRLKKFHLVFI